MDLGISSAPAANKEVSPAPPVSPLLSPSLLGLLVQTSPRPAVEPNVAELLHGFSSQVPDVTVVWRDGLGSSELEVDPGFARPLLEALPPLSTEGMSLPISAFKQWVAGWDSERRAKILDGGDLEGDAAQEEEGDREQPSASVVRVTGDDIEVVSARQVRPGDLVVVPCARGGADQYGFKPDERARVRDLSLIARDPSVREPRFVWTRELANAWLGPSAAARADDTRALLETISAEDAVLEDAADALEAWFEAVKADLPGHVLATYTRIRDLKRKRRRAWLDVDGQVVGLVLRGGKVGAEISSRAAAACRGPCAFRWRIMGAALACWRSPTLVPSGSRSHL